MPLPTRVSDGDTLSTNKDGEIILNGLSLSGRLESVEQILADSQQNLIACSSMVGDLLNAVRIWVVNRDWDPNTCRICKKIIDYEADKEGHEEWCLMFQMLAAANK